MPITKDGSNALAQTPAENFDQFLQTGVIRGDQFALRDKIDELKQISFDPAPMAAQANVIIRAAAGTTGNVVLTLPSITGTIGSPTFPITEVQGGTNQTTYAAGDLLYASATNTLSKLAAGGSQQKLTLGNSGLPMWDNNLDPSFVLEWADDFDSSSQAGDTGWGSSSGNSGQTGIGAPLDNMHQGLLKVAIGSNTASYAVGYRDVNYLFGGGAMTAEMLVYLDALSTVSQTFTARFGFGNTFDGSQPTAGAWFEYTNGVNSGQWTLNTAAASTVTTVNTASAVAATTWTKLKISINAAGTLVTFYINGVSVGTSSTNIPTTTSNKFGMILSMTQSAGTGSHLAYVDYVTLRQLFTTPR